MNKAESERLGCLFERVGYQATTTVEEADLIVLNSCVVRRSAEHRVINKIYNLRPLKQRRPFIKVALTGCLVNSDQKGLQRRFPYVDFFFQPGGSPGWLTHPKQISMLPRQPQVSTFVPIIQGCDNFCSYCIVPYRRGREKSRLLAEIVCEVRELVQRGAKEVVLLGQNVDSYGHDLQEKSDLAQLLYELNEIDGLARIRFLTNHPKDLNQRLIEAIASLDKVCEQINLPVQSGDDQILEAMRRGYNVEHYRHLVARLRHRVPQIALSTDVIVGFPHESEKQFQATASLLDELRFDSVHIAAYSPRSETIAAHQFEDSIPDEEKEKRRRLVEKLQENIATEINANLLGKTAEVLVEHRQGNKWQGRSRSGKLVFFRSDDNLLGQLVPVIIDKTSPWSLQGKTE
jgi:tRNA-2-methylthio-N6-dimethylallyladenosine synthase